MSNSWSNANGVIERHEILRTLIEIVDGKPVQQIHERWPVQLERLELSRQLPRELDAEIERLVTEQLRRPFDLTKTTGIRGTVIRIDEDDHVFVVAIHHIVCDGWSLAVLYRELEAIYRALIRNEPHHLPALKLQYGDYASWQRRNVAHNEYAKEEVFWKEYLSNAPIHWTCRRSRRDPARSRTVVIRRSSRWVATPLIACAA